MTIQFGFIKIYGIKLANYKMTFLRRIVVVMYDCVIASGYDYYKC